MNHPRRHHRDQLARDGAACAALTDRLRALIADCNYEAAQAEDGPTAEALKTLANELADAAHGPVSALAVAHEAACEDEGMATVWQPDDLLCVTLGIAAPAELPTLADVAAAFARPMARVAG